jgi:hypothetical protein
VLPNLGGTGPCLHLSPLQRQLVPAQVQRLVDLAGPDAEDLHRFHPEHELVIAISGKLIDKASLSRREKGPFKDVKFLFEAKEGKCTLLAGQHRMKALEKILDDSLAELKRLNHKLEKDPEDLDLIFEKNKLVEALRNEGKWLVAFYNSGGLCIMLLTTMF